MKLHERKILSGSTTLPALAKFIVTGMLACHLVAVADFLVHTLPEPQKCANQARKPKKCENKLLVLPVVKVRGLGGGGSAPCSHLSPPAIV